MQRNPSLSDIPALIHIMRQIGRSAADVVHGHGAKGGAYARLALTRKHALRVYTPHGGSLHFSADTLAGKFHLTTEGVLMRRTDLLLFESIYSSEEFRHKIGDPGDRQRIVWNGVSQEEFEPVSPATDATDLVFIGELRTLKGVDVMIEAIAELKRGGRTVTATIVGSGPDGASLNAQAARLGVAEAIRSMPAMPARQAQALGRIMVVPSRAESLPYVVLEAAAAAKPLIASRVGGIPEIYGPLSDLLVPPDDPTALAKAIARWLDDPAAAADAAQKISSRVAESFRLAPWLMVCLPAISRPSSGRGRAGIKPIFRPRRSIQSIRFC